MNLVSLAIKRPIMFTMVILAFVLLGLISFLGLPMNNMPEVDIPYTTVTTIYPGASPEEIENNVVKKIEDQVSTVNGLKNMTSIVLENYTYTILEFKVGMNASEVNQEVKDKLELIKSDLPTDAEDPLVQKMDLAAEAIVNLAFTTPMDRKDAFEFIDKTIVPQISKIEGVSEVIVSGGLEREIQIVMRKADLSKYMVSPLQVMQVVGKNNLSLPSGTIDPMSFNFNVKVDGEITSLDELGDIDIPSHFGIIKLKDVADIIDGVKKTETLAKFRNISEASKTSVASINLGIKKLSDANTVNLAEEVLKEVAKINKNLPQATTLNIASDESAFVKNSINDTISTIIIGIILTGLILFIFMHSFKNTFIVAITMPVTLLASFVVVGAMGFSLNMMTLMALSVSVGALVSNSVVILENINALLSKGHSAVKSAEKGTTDMVDAVIAATLTNVVVFLPIAMMDGIVGQFFVEFGVTVTVIMLFTIVIAFTLTPMMAAKMLKEKHAEDSTHDAHEKQKLTWGYKFDVIFDAIAHKYAQFLNYLLSSKVISTALIFSAIFTFVLVIKFIVPQIGNEFSSTVDEGVISVSVEFPTYYNIEKTAGELVKIEAKLADIPELKNIQTTIGILGQDKSSNGAMITLLLSSATQRDISDMDVISMVNERLSNIPDAVIKASSVSKMGGKMGEPVQLEVMGDNYDDMAHTANQLYEILKRQKGAINVGVDIKEKKPQIKIIPNKEMLSFYGIDVYTLALTVRGNVEGLEVSKFKDGGYEYDIKLLMDEKSINDPEQIKNIKIPTAKGEVSVSTLAEVEFTKAPSKITRKNKQRMIKVSSYVAGEPVGNVVNAALKEFEETVKVPYGVTVQRGGSAEMEKEASEEIGKALMIAMALTFMLIAGLLESFLQAAIILVSFPLAMIGVFVALFATGVSMNIISQLAIIMLLGIVVNNAILILDHTNALIKKGVNYKVAIVKAAELKLKAITMSTLAIMLGMLPLAIGMGEGGEFRMPMGIVSIGGLVASTILTLFIIPSIFTVSMAIKIRLSSLLFGDKK